MLKYVGFVFALIVTIALCVGLNRPIKTSSSTLPPLGSLLSPATGFWQNAERHRKSNQKINLEGLSGDVKVVYDDRLVPHVFADTDLDAMRVQGYIHAQHRLWQMDISMRATGGQLAEIMGPDLIARDKSQRRLGFDYAADKAVKAWQQNPETFAYIEAYRDGINDYIATLSPRDYPLEFKLLNYKPTPWTIKKTAIFIKSMAQTLCFREDDLEASNALRHFGPETFEFLYPEWNPKQSPIIPTGTDWNVNITAPEEEGLTPSKNVYGYRPYDKPDPFLGSNNWAVSGDKTASGNPILCNDPHLSLTLPSIWYEIQIKTPNMNSYGVSLPGVPGVIIGFNNDIAWGQTNVGHDVTDWYDIQWTNESETKYMLDGEETPVEWRIEKINVAGGEPIIDSVKYTKWGPVVHTEGGYEGMALRWIAHDITGDAELQTFIGLNQAKNYDDYSEALTHYVSPAQNYVFAARDGDIAIKVNGKLPIKRRGQGRFVQDGSTSENDWQGFIPMDEVPQVKNPARGFVSSANQHSTDPSYPYYYNTEGFEDYRGRILNEKLSAMDNITVEDMMALQNDTESIKAREVLELLLPLVADTEEAQRESSIYNALSNWNFNYARDQAAPIFFDVWWSTFYKQTWDEVYQANEEYPVLYPESWRTIALIEEEPEHTFFDHQETVEVETVKEIAQQSFNTMIEKVNSMKEEKDELRWDDYKKTKIRHLGQISAFASEVLEVGGKGDALNAISSTNGPSWRMIVELGEKVTAYGVYPGGQSGNPGSRFYDDMVDDWTNGDYFQLKFVDSPDELATDITLTQSFK